MARRDSASLAQFKVIFDRDDNFRIRVLEPEQFRDLVALKAHCSTYPEEVGEFLKLVSDFLAFVESQSKRVEDKRLKSIALRNRAQEEGASRKKRLQECQEMLNERKRVLEQINTEIRSYEEYDRVVGDHIEQLNLM